MFEFQEAIRAHGLTPPEHVQPGRFHRFAGVGKRANNTAGWCFLFPDGQGGTFGDYSTGLSESWQARREPPMTIQERESFQRQVEESRRQLEGQRLRDQQKAAAKAESVLNSAAGGDPALHPYAAKKAVPFGDRVVRGSWPQRKGDEWRDALLVKMMGERGETTSVQAISSDSQKDFLKGGRKKGTFHPFGKIRGATGRVLIGEGLATVAAAVESTGLPAMVAFDAGNLLPVAEAVRRLAPDAEIIILADDDMKDGTDENPGIEAATRAAAAVGGKVALPAMCKKADFWDLWHEQGADAVRAAIEVATPVGGQPSSCHGVDEQGRAKQLLEELAAILEKDGGLPAATWCQKLYDAKLSAVALDQIFNWMATHGIGGKRALKNDFKSFTAESAAKKNNDVIASLAGERRVVQFNPLSMNDAVRDTERAVVDVPGEWPYFAFGGVLSYWTYAQPATNRGRNCDLQPPMVPVIKPYNFHSLQLRIEQSALHAERGEKDGTETLRPIPTPVAIVQKMMDNPASLAPKVQGLVAHPLVTREGRIIAEEGFDIETGLFVAFGGAKFTEPQNTNLENARAALGRIKYSLFGEFQFRATPDHGDLYKIAAVALLLTGFSRKLMDQAPGGLVTATTQGSGKTTLLRMIHIVLTGSDMPVSSLSDNSEENTKAMLAALLESPAMLAFDNLPDGFELNDSTLAKTITSPIFKGRILGKSQEVSVPTSTLIALTGNNLTLNCDLLRRFLTIHLETGSDRPEQRSFEYRDVVQRVLEIREQVVCDCLTVVKSYIDAGRPLDENDFIPASGFAAWDYLVRFPLCWVSGVDVLQTFELGREESSENQAMTGIIRALWSMYRYLPFTATALLRELQREGVGDYDRDTIDHLRECTVLMTPRSVQNTRSLSWCLKKLAGRKIDGKCLMHSTDRFGNRASFRLAENDGTDGNIPLSPTQKI